MNTRPSSESAPYLLLFRNSGPQTFQHLSASEKQDLINQWNDWFTGLLSSGKAIEGQPLESQSRTVSGPGGSRVTDGPFAETKEAIGGYVKLVVSGLEEATEIAQRHPALAHGLIIDIRPMTPDCHLGVITRPVLSVDGAAV